jgi:hypothetical protein
MYAPHVPRPNSGRREGPVDNAKELSQPRLVFHIFVLPEPYSTGILGWQNNAND